MLRRKAVSGRSARVQDSIDQFDGLGYFLLPAHAYFLLRRDVHGRFRAVAELAQLARAEHQPPDRRLSALEDEIVGAEERDLDLRLLDPEEILDGFGDRSVPILELSLKLPQPALGFREREPAVDVDAERLGVDIRGGDIGVD